MTIFGDIVTGADVEAAVQATIERWMPDYLAEVGAKYGYARGSLPLFRSFVPSLTIDTFEEDQTPSCVIVSPGTLSNPEKRQRAMHARFALGIGCIVSGKDKDNTRLLARIYAAAVRTLIIQKPSLGEFAEGVNWISERYDAITALESASRTLGAGVLQFGVDVGYVNQAYGGPMAPTDPTVPPGDWPEVEKVVLTIDQTGS